MLQFMLTNWFLKRSRCFLFTDHQQKTCPSLCIIKTCFDLRMMLQKIYPFPKRWHHLWVDPKRVKIKKNVFFSRKGQHSGSNVSRFFLIFVVVVVVVGGNVQWTRSRSYSCSGNRLPCLPTSKKCFLYLHYLSPWNCIQWKMLNVI